MRKTVEQIEYERGAAKQQKLNAILSKYRLKKERRTVEVDEYYSGKAEREFRSWEKRFDVKTSRMKKLAATLQEIKILSTDKDRTKKKDIDKLERMRKRSEELGKPNVKEKRKKKTITKTSILTLIQKYVRLRDSDAYGQCKCISCGKWMTWKTCDGGHYISWTYNATAFDLNNIHAQCKGCNKVMSTGSKQADIIKGNYRKNLVKKIGEEAVVKLERSKNITIELNEHVNEEKKKYWTFEIKAKIDNLQPI